jgi:hypothetical protein
MTETALANGKQATGSEMSEEQYRALCKQLRQEQMRRGKNKKRAAPVMKPLGNTVTVKREFLVSSDTTDWDSLPLGATFARDAKGHVLYVKTEQNRARCLNTGKPERVGGAAVYQVFL